MHIYVNVDTCNNQPLAKKLSGFTFIFVLARKEQLQIGTINHYILSLCGLFGGYTCSIKFNPLNF